MGSTMAVVAPNSSVIVAPVRIEPTAMRLNFGRNPE